jgi:hypothetical protein
MTQQQATAVAGHMTPRKGSVNFAVFKSWKFDLDGGTIGGFLSLIARSALF